MNNNLKVVGIAVLSSIATLGSYKLLGLENKNVIFSESTTPSIGRLADFKAPIGAPGDFTYAAEISTPSVVHIKAKASRSTNVRQRGVNPFEELFGMGGNGMEDFFGQQMPQSQESSGSGVIISSDGYIATNNHVVEGSNELEVVLSDKKTYKAKVIGTDPSTDIAVIKIDVENLPAMPFANSDDVKVGEWVLAVGNPFNLESTVTAGIISAKGRDISILKDKYSRNLQRSGKASGDTPIESFIQTDAAVNPGNSGGALVNLRGELIGINTAIASPNGAYAGYAFAVPTSIVKKVTADIIGFGNVQRGYLGVNPVELDNKKAEELGTKINEGIYVAEVPETGAAKNAGVKKGDVIVKIDGIDTKSEPKFRELIGRKRPGETVKLTVNRDGSLKDINVTLRNRDGGKDLVKNDVGNKFYEALGVDLEEISVADKAKVGNGVKIKKIYEGEIANQTGLNEGFIIMKIGDKKINSVVELKKALQDAKDAGDDGVLICGKYPDSSKTICTGLGF